METDTFEALQVGDEVIVRLFDAAGDVRVLLPGSHQVIVSVLGLDLALSRHELAVVDFAR